MIDPARKEVLRLLEELSETCPEYRFGQMIANLAMLARGDAEGAIWEMEDEELLGAIRWQLQQLSSRPAAVDAEPTAAPDQAGQRNPSGS